MYLTTLSDVSVFACEHIAEVAIGKTGSVAVQIEDSMDESNNDIAGPLFSIRHPKAGKMLTLLRTEGPEYSHKLPSTLLSFFRLFVYCTFALAKKADPINNHHAKCVPDGYYSLTKEALKFIQSR
jgi:hypothetical protein